MRMREGQKVRRNKNLAPREIKFSTPAPTRMHKGAACAFTCSRERGVFFGRSLGKISQENQERGVVFFLLPTVTDIRDGGGGYILGYPFPEIGGGGSGDGE